MVKMNNFFSHLNGNKLDEVYDEITQISNLDKDSMDAEILYVETLLYKVYKLIFKSRENLHEHVYLKSVIKQESSNSETSKEELDALILEYNEQKLNLNVLSFEQIHSMLLLLDSCINKIIPKNLSPIFILGRTSQQLVSVAYNFAEDCAIPLTEQYKINLDAVDCCCDDMSIAQELISGVSNIISGEK